MSKLRITKLVGEYYFGSGSINKLDQMIKLKRTAGSSVAFLVDHYFKTSGFIECLPVSKKDELLFIDTSHEPTTKQIDDLANRLRAKKDVSVVIGLGGGSTLDCAKATSNLLNNEGSAADYQGWDLLENPGVYKIGVPTISGTGAEASRTCVIMNHKKNLKLGMNSDYTVFDKLILDPDLTKTVPPEQYFFTGMDTYIHCIESLAGNYRHPISDSLSKQGLELVRQVFLLGDMMQDSSREALMTASYLGGSAIGNSYVGVVHPLSAGLSMVLGYNHCIANCIVMNVMEEYYPRETDEFHIMLKKNGIKLPTKITQGLSNNKFNELYKASIIHEKPLENALGKNFRDKFNFETIRKLFERM